MPQWDSNGNRIVPGAAKLRQRQELVMDALGVDPGTAGEAILPALDGPENLRQAELMHMNNGLLISAEARIRNQVKLMKESAGGDVPESDHVLTKYDHIFLADIYAHLLAYVENFAVWPNGAYRAAFRDDGPSIPLEKAIDLYFDSDADGSAGAIEFAHFAKLCGWKIGKTTVINAKQAQKLPDELASDGINIVLDCPLPRVTNTLVIDHHISIDETTTTELSKHPNMNILAHPINFNGQKVTFTTSELVYGMIVNAANQSETLRRKLKEPYATDDLRDQFTVMDILKTLADVGRFCDAPKELILESLRDRKLEYCDWGIAAGLLLSKFATYLTDNTREGLCNFDSLSNNLMRYAARFASLVKSQKALREAESKIGIFPNDLESIVKSLRGGQFVIGKESPEVADAWGKTLVEAIVSDEYFGAKTPGFYTGVIRNINETGKVIKQEINGAQGILASGLWNPDKVLLNTVNALVGRSDLVSYSGRSIAVSEEARFKNRGSAFLGSAIYKNNTLVGYDVSWRISEHFAENEDGTPGNVNITDELASMLRSKELLGKITFGGKVTGEGGGFMTVAQFNTTQSYLLEKAKKMNLLIHEKDVYGSVLRPIFVAK